jgi:hypothetical protein
MNIIRSTLPKASPRLGSRLRDDGLLKPSDRVDPTPARAERRHHLTGISLRLLLQQRRWTVRQARIGDKEGRIIDEATGVKLANH